MTTTKKQQENFDALAKEYASSVFGIEPREDIQNIKPGLSGVFQVKDDVNIDANYLYQNLFCEGKIVATNNPQELPAHKHFIEKAHGRVLISGLGLGNSLNEVLKKENVSFVLIVEKEQDIINLVAPYFNDPRVKIIHGDIFKYLPDDNFDCIYHAIWNTEKEAKGAVEVRKKLRKQFDPFCSWQGFIYISPRGGARKSAGRKIGTIGPNKPEEDKKSIRKGVRYKQKEFDIIKQACELSGKSASEIAVSGAIKEATRIIFGIDDPKIEELVKKAIS